VSAWAENNGLVLGQIKVADKSNEITALSGCIVTVDAVGCQKKIAKEIIESDADYVLARKHRLAENSLTFLTVLVFERPPRTKGVSRKFTIPPSVF
jgi:hypothetical protein